MGKSARSLGDLKASVKPQILKTAQPPLVSQPKLATDEATIAWDTSGF